MKGIKEMELEPAVTYERISKEREEQTSTKVQRRGMESFCETYDLNIIESFTELGVSAFKGVERPELDKALAMIEAGQAKVLLVWKLDRLTRNVREFWKILQRLEAAGGIFKSVQEPFLNTDSPIAMAITQLFAALAEEEAKGIQARALGWHAHRRRNGQVPTGPRPYGYHRPKPDEDGWIKGGTLIPVADEVAIVLEAAERVLAGDSLRAMCRDFDARGIPTISGKGWNHSTIRTFLLNPTVIAELKDGTQGTWAPIMERGMWEAVGAMLTDPERTSHVEGGSDARKLKHLLPGLMMCGKCNGRLITKCHSRGRQYGCESCELSIMAEVADDLVNAWISDNVSDVDWKSAMVAGKGTDPKVIEDIQARIDEAFIERATNPNRVSPAVYESVMANLEAQLEAATSEPSVKLPDVDDLHEAWPTMANNDKRLVIEAFIGSITVLPYCKGQTGTNRIIINGKEDK